MLKKLIYIYLFATLISNYTYAQQFKIDSLCKKISACKNDTQKVNLLNTLFLIYNKSNTDSALSICKLAYKTSVLIGFIDGKIKAANHLSSIYYFRGNNTEALKYNIEVTSLIETQPNKNSPLHLQLLSSALNNMGLIFQQQKLYNKAIEYFKKSIAIDEKSNDKLSMAHAYNNIGTIMQDLNKQDEALVNLELSLKLKKEVMDSGGITSALINIGVIKMNQKKFKEATKNLQDALILAQKFKNVQDEALALINLGDLNNLTKDYFRSIHYYQLGIEICKKQKYLQFLNYSYDAISLSYYQMKNFEKAYDYYKLYTKTKDTIFNQDNSKILHELETKFETKSKEKEIKLLTIDKEFQKVEIQKNKVVLYSTLLGLLLISGFAGYAFYANKQKQKINYELALKNKKIEFAYNLIDEKQKEILDSIHYAKRIQDSLLAHKDFLTAHIPNNFLLFKPKDIVSGDFYWATEHQNKFYLAICDSTGHGVPGAFMSLLNIGYMSEAIKEKNITEPHNVFNYVRERLINSISKEEQKDGMDGILLCIEAGPNNNKVITYAAANNTPIQIRNNKIIDLPKDRMPVGKGEKTSAFTLYTIDAKLGDTLYLYTDGFADQFGGSNGKKFKSKKLNELLISINQQPLGQQSLILNSTFQNWKGNLEQVDDVCVVGIRI